MSVPESDGAVVAWLRRQRGSQEALMRWLLVLGPLLLIVLVITVARTDPRPATHGRGLVVAIATGVFCVTVVARNVLEYRLGLAIRRDNRRYLPLVVVMLGAAITLMAVQPGGAAAGAVLAAVLCVVVVLPRPVVIPVLVGAFVVVEVLAALSGQTLGDLAILAALAAIYGMLLLAARLALATRRAERLLSELERSQAALAEASALAERQRLAREMHDVLAHSLSGLTLQLEAARLLVANDPTDPRLPEAVERAHRLGRTGLDEARRAIGTLRDDELPGPERLGALAERFTLDRGVPCEFVVTGTPYDLASEARLAVYRVAQEALTNISKHARPTRVALHLSYLPSHARLEVEDVGTGVAPTGSASAGPGGYGLTGMRERAELIGGRLTAAPTATGFRVELEVPA